MKGSSHADCSFSTVEPPLDFVSQRSHYVLVPGSGTVSTQLSCDIGPGAGREVQWNRLNSDGTFTPVTEGINQENFNLMLPVDVNSDSAVYRCTVTIDLGGNLRSYNGANITLRAAGKLPLLCASPTQEKPLIVLASVFYTYVLCLQLSLCLIFPHNVLITYLSQ